MHTENHMVIDAHPSVVYRLAVEIQDWPRLLAHYRYVTVHEGDTDTERPGSRRVTMAASRSRIPVRWTSIQSWWPTDYTIMYRHVAGLTTGMDVEWRIVGDGARTDVRIIHDLSGGGWWFRVPLAETIAARGFVMHIAHRTLLGIKQAAEASAAAIAP